MPTIVKSPAKLLTTHQLLPGFHLMGLHKHACIDTFRSQQMYGSAQPKCLFQVARISWRIQDLRVLVFQSLSESALEACEEADLLGACVLFVGCKVTAIPLAPWRTAWRSFLSRSR